MSKLATARGDDYPEAAGKHLQDASALLTAGRADGAAYLSGYVVECSLKSLLQLESKDPWGHSISRLTDQFVSVAAIAGSRTARYLGSAVAALTSSQIGNWNPEHRYRAPSVSLADAQAWYVEAQQVFDETVAEMWKDGVL